MRCINLLLLFNYAFFFFLSHFFFIYFFLFKKKEERVGGHYWQIVLHTGTGEKKNPVLPMGRRKKTLVGHRKLVIKSKQASGALPSSSSGLLAKN